MATGFLWDERFAWHDAGRASQSPWAEPYPALDRPESKRRLRNLLEVSGLLQRLAPLAARPATETELLRFHSHAYLKRVRALSENGGGDAGESAVLGPGGYEIASLAAGGCIEAVDAVLRGEVDNAYALVRPAGHHAEPERGRGFCIFGNIAIAVHHAKAVRGIERVAVVDWDVHHGNGTQMAFYDDPTVLTVSLHQEHCYPVDSGGIEETGTGAGHGFNLNLPLPPGSGHGAYLAAFEQIVLPMLRAFRPELIMVACGLDAGINDPLGRMLCFSESFRCMTRHLKALAGEVCDGRLVLCHEGGYSPTYAPFCGLAVIEELSGERSEVVDPMAAWYARMGGQMLQPHQARLLERLARRITVLAGPEPARPAARRRVAS
jgi:acetoin utilization deacetylase AcuC-like enzyme